MKNYQLNSMALMDHKKNMDTRDCVFPIDFFI